MTIFNKDDDIKKEESCILVAEVEGFIHYYNVAVPEIEKGMKAIKASYDFFHKTCSRIYIAGFTLVSEGSNLSVEAISDKVEFLTNLQSKNEEKENTLEQSK